MTPATRFQSGLLHVLFSLRAEGCPRLALGMLQEERRQTGLAGNAAVLHTQPPDLAELYRSHDFPVHYLEYRTHHYGALFLATERLIRRLRPRGLICYPIGPHVPIAAAAAWHDLPCVVHVGTSPPTNQRAKRLIAVQMAAGLPFVTAYACCSASVRRQCISAYHLPQAQCHTVYNGIDLNRFLKLRPGRVGRPGPVLRVGMVASLEPSKDHATLLRAIALLRKRGEQVVLRLIGGGTLLAELRQLADSLEIADAVEWAGAVGDVPRELAELDVFAFSIKPEEGLGIALVEALAAGLPAVATDEPAAREVFRDYPAGVLTRPRDPASLAEGILVAATRPPADPASLERFAIATTTRHYLELARRG